MNTIRLEIPINPATSPELLHRGLSEQTLGMIKAMVEASLVYPDSIPHSDEDKELRRTLPLDFGWT